MICLEQWIFLFFLSKNTSMSNQKFKSQSGCFCLKPVLLSICPSVFLSPSSLVLEERIKGPLNSPQGRGDHHEDGHPGRLTRRRQSGVSFNISSSSESTFTGGQTWKPSLNEWMAVGVQVSLFLLKVFYLFWNTHKSLAPTIKMPRKKMYLQLLTGL